MEIYGFLKTEDRRNKSAVRESGRISELKCLELFEGIVPEFAVMQQNLKQSLKRLEGDLAAAAVKTRFFRIWRRDSLVGNHRSIDGAQVYRGRLLACQGNWAPSVLCQIPSPNGYTKNRSWRYQKSDDTGESK